MNRSKKRKQDQDQEETKEIKEIKCNLCKVSVVSIGLHLVQKHYKCLACHKWFLDQTTHSTLPCKECKMWTCPMTKAAHFLSFPDCKPKQKVTYEPAPPSLKSKAKNLPPFITVKCTRHKNVIVSKQTIRNCHRCRVIRYSQVL